MKLASFHPRHVLLCMAIAGCGSDHQRETGRDSAMAARPGPDSVPVVVQPLPLAPAADSTDDAPLAPGRFEWHPERSPSGPVLMVVSIPEQMAHLYRNGVAIGVSTVSTGRKGHRTPTGVFTILEKNRRHFSSTYNGAPMPFQERLTWDGIALHAGNLPGYPASHGCVRLPMEFAKLLYSVTEKGGTVIIADDRSFQATVAHPGLVAPQLPGTDSLAPGADSGWTWVPERAPSGPTSLVLSWRSREVHVLRNGVEIGRAPVTIRQPEVPLTPAVYVQTEQVSNMPNPFVPGRPMALWMVVGDSGLHAVAHHEIPTRVVVPPTFAARVAEILEPGVTLVVTNQRLTPAARSTSGFSVVDAVD